MKKICLKIVLIIFILFILSKIYDFIIVNKLYYAIENFRNAENKYCAVSIKEENTNRKEKLLAKGKISKYFQEKENKTYLEWKDFDKNEQYTINVEKKEYSKNNSSLYLDGDLLYIPRFVLSMIQKETFDINAIFNVYYISLTKYNDKICYKIVTKNETIIIDKDTYLPVYSSRGILNMEKNYNDKIEYIYEFEVGNVTDEDVALPDLSDYTVTD